MTGVFPGDSLLAVGCSCDPNPPPLPGTEILFRAFSHLRPPSL